MKKQSRHGTVPCPITAVCKQNGSYVMTYTYDAWGKVECTAQSDDISDILIALLFTPITYRGYNYDVFTGLYYLQSRYYNPTYGRFLNADTTEILEATQGTPLGANLFAYCNNNPVNYVDYGGMLCVGAGVFFSAAYGLAVSIALMVIGDSEGNAGLFIIWGVGIGLPSISGGVAFMIDSTHTIFDLVGESYSFGFSASTGAMIGGDALVSSGEISGVQLLIGGSANGYGFFEAHALINNTVLLFSWKTRSSIANTIRGVYEMLKFYGFDV